MMSKYDDFDLDLINIKSEDDTIKLPELPGNTNDCQSVGIIRECYIVTGPCSPTYKCEVI